MQHKTLLYLLLVNITFIIAGCSSKDDPGCNMLTPHITTDTEVLAGSTLQLSASDVDNVAFYNWYGPDGFTSHQSAPYIYNMSATQAGVYAVDIITNDGCIYTTSDTIKVIAAEAPCTISNNTADLNAVGTVSLSSISSSLNGGAYEIDASGGGIYVYLQFYGTSSPVTGVYNVEEIYGSLWGPGHVDVYMQSYNTRWHTGSGKVYVTASNGKTEISFCDLQFISETYGYSSTGSARITMP